MGADLAPGFGPLAATWGADTIETGRKGITFRSGAGVGLGMGAATLIGAAGVTGLTGNTVRMGAGFGIATGAIGLMGILENCFTTGFCAALAATFETGTFETGTFETGTLETGTLETGTFETETFETGTFDPGRNGITFRFFKPLNSFKGAGINAVEAAFKIFLPGFALAFFCTIGAVFTAGAVTVGLIAVAAAFGLLCPITVKVLPLG